MKIGVFGDSFASAGDGKIWWKYLETDYGHDVECFGEGGSSLVFSAKKVLENFSKYDLVIWCVTSSMRATVWHRADYKEISVHVTGRHHMVHDNPEIQRKINATEQYLLEAWDAPEGEFVSICIIEHVRTLVKNMLIIPSFGPPMQRISGAKFNLFDLCQQETDFYFNGKSLGDIYDKYTDIRFGHFTESTHKKLAELVSKSLSPGIFTANYQDFPAPTEPFDQIFRKINS